MGPGHLALFEFVGRVLGKALYEGIVVQPNFAHFFLSKLLGKHNYLHDLPSYSPELYKNLMFLKSYEGDAADLCLNFVATQNACGESREVELAPGGADIDVTNRNKLRYINQVAHFHLNTQIKPQCDAFLAGLRELVPLRLLRMYSEPELQHLISGSAVVDVADLRAHTRYTGGYTSFDRQVKRFWRVAEALDAPQRALLLKFATSCERAPPLGFGSLHPRFCLQRVPIRADGDKLPTAATCFNTLKLPTYSSEKVLRAKLLLAITSGAGFEMS